MSPAAFLLTIALAGCAASGPDPAPRIEGKAGPDPRVLFRMADEATGRAHDGAVEVLALSPDGRRLASGGADGTVRVWNARTGSPEAVVLRTGAPVRAIAFSFDGKYLSAGGDNRAWDVLATDGWVRVGGMTELPAPVLEVRFLGRGMDGRALCADGIEAYCFAGRWGTERGEGLQRMGLHVLPLHCMVTTGRTGEVYLAEADDGGAIVVDHLRFDVDYLRNRRRVAEVPGAHDGSVTALVGWDSPGLLYSGGADGAIRAWSVPALEMRGEIVDRGIAVTALMISGDETVLWAGRADGSILGYDTRAMRPSQEGK